MKLSVKRRAFILVPVCALVLGACSFHAVEDNPKVDIVVPTSFSIDGGTEDSTKEFRGSWWQSFERTTLNSFIDQALLSNYDLAQALAAIEQAEALARQAGAQKWPQLGVSGYKNRYFEGNQSRPNSYGGSLSLNWELDIWKRVSNAHKSNLLQVEARNNYAQAVRLSLSAEVANAYFGAVAAMEQIALLKQQLKLDEELEHILQLRLESGVGTNVELLQQQARVADNETLIPLAESTLAVFENRLDVLLGQAPDGQPRVPASDTLDFAAELPAVGVPSALLLNRPDLLAERAELIAADADIGVAIANRLPLVSIDGSYRYDGVNGSSSSPLGVITGRFVQPLLDWGRRKAEVKRNKALYKERLAAYTQRYLEAVEDVENALIQEAKQREFLNKLSVQRDILKRAAVSAEKRYKRGIDDYQPVINALQELRVIERSLVGERLNLINLRIELFRAIGGPIVNTNVQSQN